MSTLRVSTRGWRSGDEDGHKFLMSVNGKGFCEEISKIVFTLEPGDYEVTLSYAITNPMKIHVDALGTTRCDGVVGYANGASVVAKN